MSRAKHGRNGIWSTPTKLWNDCVEYFKWVEANPLVEQKAFSYQGDVSVVDLTKMRAMTKNGLCIHLGISQTAWDNYKAKEDFVGVTTRVEEIIYEQKFTGAAADLLNHNIIARDLGLRDKVDSEITGKDGEPLVPVINVTIGKP